MANSRTLLKEIADLKERRDALILAHYYVPLEVQDAADKVGDSFALAKFAKKTDHKVIVMCGVSFMGESAKILSPEKTVLLPDRTAGCPMADMITPDKVLELKARHQDAAVMCYVNSSASTKAVSDICCTSSSALPLARELENKEIIFVPDMNLGSYIAAEVPEKKFWFYDGYCPVHNSLREENILRLKEKHPNAVVAAHPECRSEVLALADFIGSTSGILDFAEKTEAEEIIIATEIEITRKLSREHPEKKFFNAAEDFVCENMKKITLEALRDCLRDGRYEVELSEEELKNAKRSLDRMVGI